MTEERLQQIRSLVETPAEVITGDHARAQAALAACVPELLAEIDSERAAWVKGYATCHALWNLYRGEEVHPEDWERSLGQAEKAFNKYGEVDVCGSMSTMRK